MSTGLTCHALVVGIDDYRGGISPLDSAVRDAAAIAGLLQTDHDYSVVCLRDGEALGAAILDYLTDTLPPRLSEESGFLFYFAGHGVAIGDGTQGPKGFLLPHDAEPMNEDSWLSVEALREALDALPCRHLLTVLDCCFAGSFRWASTRDAYISRGPLYDSQFERYLKGNAWQALTSASHDERAADLAPGRHNQRDADGLESHSPFAAAFIRGLSGAADSARGGFEPDGVITATELYQYVFEELARPGGGSTQTPGIWPLRPDNKGEYVFLNPGVSLNTEPDPPLDDENNPWLGLAAYSMDEADRFFGRQRVIDDLLDRLADEAAGSLLAVVGASGTGKSSVVKAGLLSQLTHLPDDAQDRTHHWSVIHAERLTEEPTRQLEAVLADLRELREGSKAIVLFDQFEELYTQCPDNDARLAFLGRLRSLIDTPDGPTVVLTLRSDFEPRPASSEALRDLWADARFVVPAFSHEELREVIEGPANVKALFFEPVDLVGKLLEETIAMPGALPLLSFALAEMYRHAQLRRRQSGSADRALTRGDYEGIGGVVGALHKRATLLYEQSDAHDRETIRRVFLRTLSQDGARLTRRRVSTAELDFGDQSEQPRVEAVVARFVDARLLVRDGDFVEPAHDTLVVAWEQLQDWLAAAGPQAMIRSVWRDANDWLAHRKDKGASGFLWNNDPRLPQIETMRTELNRLEREFVSASTRKKKRERNWTVCITASVIAVLLAATVFSYRQLIEAQRQLAQTQWSAGVEWRDARNDGTRAAHWFARSAASPDDDLADSSRFAAVLETRGFELAHVFPHSGLAGATLNRDHQRILSWGADQPFRSWDLLNGRPVFGEQPYHPGLSGAVLNDGGTQMLSWSVQGSVVLWDALTGARIFDWSREHEGIVNGAAFDATGTRSLSWGDDGTIRLRDVVTGEAMAGQPMSHDGPVHRAIFNRSGTHVLSWGADDQIRLWDASSGATLFPALGLYGGVVGARFIDAESLILGWDDTGTLRIWDASSGELEFELEHQNLGAPGLDVAVSRDEKRILSWNRFGVRMWNVDTGAAAFDKAMEHDEAPLGATFNADGSRIMSWSTDGIRLWYTSSGGPVFVNPLRHDGPVAGAVFTRDGTRVLSWGDDGTARLWDATTGEQISGTPLHHAESVSGAMFDRDETMILSWDPGGLRAWRMHVTAPIAAALTGNDPRRYDATFNSAGTRILSDTNGFWIWNTSTGAALVPTSPDEDIDVRGATFDAAGNYALTWSWENELQLWDAETGARIPTQKMAHGHSLSGGAFSGDATRLLSWDTAGEVRVWHAESGELARKLDHESSVDSAVFSDAKGRVLSLGEDGSLRSWNLASGRRLFEVTPDEPVSGVLLSKDESRILGWSRSGILLWDAATGDMVLRKPLEHDGNVVAATFSEDGARIISSGTDGGRVWHADSGLPVFEFPFHDRAQFSGASFNGDQSRVLSWGQDGAVRVLDTATGQPTLEAPLAHDAEVRGATFSAPVLAS